MKIIIKNIIDNKMCFNLNPILYNCITEKKCNKHYIAKCQHSNMPNSVL